MNLALVWYYPEYVLFASPAAACALAEMNQNQRIHSITRVAFLSLAFPWVACTAIDAAAAAAAGRKSVPEADRHEPAGSGAESDGAPAQNPRRRAMKCRRVK